MSIIPLTILREFKVKRLKQSQYSCKCQRSSLPPVPCHTLLSSSIMSKLILAQCIFTVLQSVKPQVCLYWASSWNSTAEFSKHQTGWKVRHKGLEDMSSDCQSPPLHWGRIKDTQTNRCCLSYSLKAAEEKDTSVPWGYPVQVFSTICSVSHFPRYLEELKTWIPTTEHSSLAARILHGPVHMSGERLPQSTNSVPPPPPPPAQSSPASFNHPP